MSFVNRQLYKQKPQAWGPVSSVQVSMFKNAEKCGINPSLFDCLFPIWDKVGLPRNYVTGNTCSLCGGSTTTPSWGIKQSSGILSNITDGFYSDNYQRDIPAYGDYTWVVSFNVNIYGTYGVVFGNRYGGVTYPLQFVKLQGELFSFYNNNDYLLTFPLIGINTDNFVVITKKNQTITVYKNGKQISSISNVTAAMAANPLIFGNGSLTSITEVTATFYYLAFTGAFSLTSSQIAYLNDNPYFLLHRVPPVFYSVPGGGIIIKNITDSCIVTDSISQISNFFSVSDAGTGADGFAGLTAGLSVVDAGSGADVITVLKELLKTVTDSGTGTDSISRILASLSVADTGSSTDTISQILAGVSVSDTGTGVDFIALLKDILKTISDTGSGSDSVSIQPVSVSVQDAGTALDIIGHIAVALSVSDAGTIAEIISTIKTKMVTVTDTGTGSDSVPTISVSLTVSDTAVALDLVGQVINSLTVSDTGYGLDRITKTDFDILPSGKVMVTFTIKTPGASFAMRTPKATFNIE